MTHRAIELLGLTEPSFILDIGCGSGLSGEILSEDDHTWIGLDISPSMLDIALQREVEGDLFLWIWDKDYRFELALSMLQFPYQPYNGFATLIPPLFPQRGGCDAFSTPCTPACAEVEGLSANFIPRTTSREV